MSEVARNALLVNLLTEDNLPSYHHEIATIFGRDDAWGSWVHRWTAEEGRHGIAMRDYLVVKRSVDPVESLQRFRMTHMSQGYLRGPRRLDDALARLRLVPGLATRVKPPQHGEVPRLLDGREAARPDRGGREPPHGLLPEPHAGRDRLRARPGGAGDPSRWSPGSGCPAPTSPGSSARRSRWPSPASTTCARTATRSSCRCCATGKIFELEGLSQEGEAGAHGAVELHGWPRQAGGPVRGQAGHPQVAHEHQLRRHPRGTDSRMLRRGCPPVDTTRCPGARWGRGPSPRTPRSASEQANQPTPSARCPSVLSRTGGFFHERRQQHDERTTSEHRVKAVDQ